MAYKCRLKVIFAENNIKHGQFADLIGIDKSTMSSIVNGKSLPSFDTLYDIVEEIRKINPDVRLNDIWRKE
ncbi:helix-turn-helix transcriptional regulator [Rossellomorea sp. DA94]|uniref:helix-turn-helix transcriptional regulator n=1 Tax=Rossellomorea sp. DA94 TaxID=3038653 RepID=UPI00244AF9CB|nr:helix-turn-helix transcriptional regulator [Rossellomorea sp. DA94]WGG47700.1 helix-turn-helix transcriptional regulator [Rossellomorea sp. DA94]